MSDVTLKLFIMKEQFEDFVFTVWDSINCIRELAHRDLPKEIFEYFVRMYWLMETGQMVVQYPYKKLHCYCAYPHEPCDYPNAFEEYLKMVYTISSHEHHDANTPCSVDTWLL